MKKQTYILYVLALLILIFNVVTVFLLIEYKFKLVPSIANMVEEKVESIEIPKDGYTPIKNVDYFDGKPGENGANGKSIKGDRGDKGQTGKPGKSAYDLAVDGGFVGSLEEWLKSLQPADTRCNSDKNRWEVKYPLENNWQVMNGEVVPCVGVKL